MNLHLRLTKEMSDLIVGKAHQRIIREEIADREPDDLFGRYYDNINTSLNLATVCEIDKKEAEQIILQYEWLGTMPPVITGCYGMKLDGHLAGALVFAFKPGMNLKGSKNSVIPVDAHYLARGACVHWAHPHSASWFIAKVCNTFLAPCTVVAYSDPAAGEVGTIYQALGWHYIGAGKGGPTGYLVDGELIQTRKLVRDGHGGRGINAVRSAFPDAKKITPVPRKARYIGVYGNKRYKKQATKKLLPFIRPYPKRKPLASEADND